MNFKKTMLASLLMISASGAFAATTGSLAVKGTISAATCDVTIGGATTNTLTFDVGDYNGTSKVLSPQTIDFNISCAPNALAMKFKVLDDKRSSGPDGATNSFGLGMHDGSRIGAYKLNMTGMTADTNTARMLSRVVASPVWSAGPSGVISGDGGSGVEYTFGNPAALTPMIANSFSSTLTVAPTINAGLPVLDPVELDGSLSVEIFSI